jgi:transposase-like protein
VEESGERIISCPWCESGEIEMVAEFGPHLMVSQFICRECRSPFEVIRR